MVRLTSSTSTFGSTFFSTIGFSMGGEMIGLGIGFGLGVGVNTCCMFRLIFFSCFFGGRNFSSSKLVVTSHQISKCIKKESTKPINILMRYSLCNALSAVVV